MRHRSSLRRALKSESAGSPAPPAGRNPQGRLANWLMGPAEPPPPREKTVGTNFGTDDLLSRRLFYLPTTLKKGLADVLAKSVPPLPIGGWACRSPRSRKEPYPPPHGPIRESHPSRSANWIPFRPLRIVLFRSRAWGWGCSSLPPDRAAHRRS
jgi:hypothetical protein